MFPADAIKGSLRQSRWRPSAADIWVYGLTFGPGILLLAAISLQTGIPASVLMKDPLAVVLRTGTCCQFYYGFVSNLGVMLWTGAAAICLFASLFLFSLGRRGDEPRFLAAAGLLTAWLALDDLFMIHDDLLPSLGVPEPITYVAYAGLAGIYFRLSWHRILACRPELMAAALALLGFSVFIDMIDPPARALRVLGEDGAKFLGILAWTGFHVNAALEASRRLAIGLRA